MSDLHNKLRIISHLASMLFARTSQRQRLMGIIVTLFVSMMLLMHHTSTSTDSGVTKSYLSNSLDKLNGFYKETKKTYVSDYTQMTFEEITDALTFKHKSDKRRKEIIKDNMKHYTEFVLTKINEPKTGNLVRGPAEKEEYVLANATLLVLVRNKELDGLIKTITQIEEKFNKKFHYPYTLINDEAFTDNFKKKVEEVASGKIEYVHLTPEEWGTPSHLDQKKIDRAFDMMEEQHIQYGTLLSYRHMCRFNSATFYNLPALKKYKWYWRFEPDTDYYCEIDYDLFKFMEDNDKTYGFTINLYDHPITVETLWRVTMEFVKEHPEYVHPNGAFEWLTNDLQNPWHALFTGGYSGCHFWSNFEIGDMDFFRAEPYTKWMERLNENGGFYYERWGDAPVHSIGLGLFADKSKVHWFRDIGYRHGPYANCPNSDKCRGCRATEFGPESLYTENCMAQWIDYSMVDKDFALY
ncbi:glycosyltransferase family 15 protein [Babjeviella inositovora NRRL Y-12698]|uniref:Glycosyltransferase family 15 protein n=1 Tax=Babjeviella inositovora NRRL Y-12698 TaxID=984486 RepID=A0A1E3QYP7_9ASCO|nr:glycosyltransferase family 15 protein [Babjeviella inositovora NRRL Y-12698]ODQ82217.1 glycosyltransferase family 15 protein [Babjeviella inositovora NRRL Y-12698]